VTETRRQSNRGRGESTRQALRGAQSAPQIQPTPTVFRADGIYFGDGRHGPAPKRRSLFRDLLIAATLGIVAIIGYPSIEPHLPPTWQANIASVMGRFAPSPGVAEREAIVVSDVNLRAGPSTTTKVIALLPRGSRVATTETRGEWTFVQVEAYSRNSQLRRGWVYATFLENVGDGEDDAETESSEDSD
jgi:hypothetical protein